MEKYNPHVDITNEEGRKAFTELVKFEDKMLVKPFSELSYEDLITVRKILARKKEAIDGYNKSLSNLASQKPDERAEVVTEDVMQSFYDMGHEFDKDHPDPTDLEIIEGLIRKAERGKKD